MNFLHNTFIVLSLLPFFPFLIVYFTVYALKKDKKQALLIAFDITTVFLVVSVAALFNNIFNSSFGFYLILLLLIIMMGFIGGAQNRLKGEVNWTRLFRAVWRITFIGTSICYALFTIIGLFRYIFNMM
ncbi:hypothetical protein D3C74_20270 [compost metagenome]